MDVTVCETKRALGEAAARKGAAHLRQTLNEKPHATIILATGASQFDMLDALVQAEGIDWGRITAFHLDEYIGLTREHPASFRRYLKERFVDRLPESIRAFHYVHGDRDPEAECRRLGQVIAATTVDVAFVGIGENGHLAFNDPLADFETTAPYLIVALDEACRRQQMDEGWFDQLADVPECAISMSIHQIMKSEMIICSVPERRKAPAVRLTLEGRVTPEVPASILQRHPNCHLFLDRNSAPTGS